MLQGLRTAGVAFNSVSARSVIIAVLEERVPALLCWHFRRLILMDAKLLVQALEVGHQERWVRWFGVAAMLTGLGVCIVWLPHNLTQVCALHGCKAS